MSLAVNALDGALLIPELLEAAPQVRPVLDRYGLRGCGGPLGPRESLAFFAHAHDVPLDRLLSELRSSLGQPAAPPSEQASTSHLGDAIYRPFFRAGIVVVLTVGAVWGAYLLLRIGLGGSFTAVSLHEVNAHGHAQIFGWVGLFVMGFAYQAFPRFKHSELSHPRLAYASLVLMLAGLIVRSVCEPLIDTAAWVWLPAVGGSFLEMAAILLFSGVILATWRAAGKPLAVYDYYIVSALFWFVVQAVYESVYLAATATATGHELVNLVATWQGALREIQIHGFALLMILGVSQRIFHHFYGLPAPSPRLGVWALLCLNAAIVGEILGLVLMRRAGHGWAMLWYGSVLLLCGAVVALVRNWHIFARAQETDRSLKFLRAAYVWLFISLAMLVLLPLYQHGLLALLAPDGAAHRIGFSHAYYGAIRHAITVGFISLMIMGVAAKVVPTLNGVEVRRLSALWLPFVLVNAGCGLRVTGQTLTDFAPGWFPVTGVSGLLEVTGLALWGVHLWSVMAGRARLRSSPLPTIPPPVGEGKGGGATPLLPGEPIVGTNLVNDVLDMYPRLLTTFVAFGFRPLASAVLRKTMARGMTVAGACRFLGVDLERLLVALNRERANESGGMRALPLISTN